jgi:hypothetical protein
VTQSGAATLTVGPPPVFTIAPLPAQNPYASGWQIVQQGAPMVYTVLPPPGYTGWIQLSSVGVGCVINAPVFGVSGWGTGNADGSLTVTVTQDPVGFPASPCAQQSLQTYGNKIFLNLAIAVYGVNPPVNQQTFNMPLEVTTVPAISLGVSLLSQTSGAATYLATVSTTSYAGGGDPESGAGIDDSGRDDDFQLEHGDWRNVLLVHGDGATGIVFGDGAAGGPGDAAAERGGVCDTGDAGGRRGLAV